MYMQFTTTILAKRRADYTRMDLDLLPYSGKGSNSHILKITGYTTRVCDKRSFRKEVDIF